MLLEQCNFVPSTACNNVIDTMNEWFFEAIKFPQPMVSACTLSVYSKTLTYCHIHTFCKANYYQFGFGFTIAIILTMHIIHVCNSKLWPHLTFRLVEFFTLVVHCAVHVCLPMCLLWLVCMRGSMASHVFHRVCQGSQLHVQECNLFITGKNGLFRPLQLWEQNCKLIWAMSLSARWLLTLYSEVYFTWRGVQWAVHMAWIPAFPSNSDSRFFNVFVCPHQQHMAQVCACTQYIVILSIGLLLWVSRHFIVLWRFWWCFGHSD